ncbi:dethiobiotin synthase [Luteimonas chenhongjianii]|uniref:ATP-dependent dethiobiotin synthetase BioD n=1 Tax=Luteimonas chenhongjianii TaxID=2006110 RepID=A0A290XFD0_9GAMM|nr:dethiobiotin synthase [Luteimonas chenhongjianii]ATD67845.1 dethiobiotin synthase [Luteimonas chenhongjianii]
MTSRSLLVTGTDTGIGKTHSSVALLHALRGNGLRAVGMKPVASGCDWRDGGWRNDDALALQAASDPRPDYADVNPFALPEPTAPTLAARAAGVHVDVAMLYAAYARLADTADLVVVEGAGGWDAPLAEGLEHRDLARHLGGAVVMVVGLRLGCLSHARLTARAVAADGCRLIGWIGNRIDPDFARADDYVELLDRALPAPCLGILPFGVDPVRAAGHLVVDAVLAERSSSP